MDTDVDSGGARALRLYRSLMAGLGPVSAPFRERLARARRILDVGCGDGWWLIELAQTHRIKECFGVDSDRHAIHRAANAAIARNLSRTVFWQQDDLAELDPDICESDAFGFVRASFLSRLLLTTDFPKLAKNLYRVTSSGGVIAWTECELPVTSSPALQEVFALILRGLDAVGHRYGPPTELELLMMQRWKEAGLPDPRRTHLCMTPHLSSWLTSAGFRQVQIEAFAIDISAYNQAMHTVFCEQAMVFLQTIQPFIFKANIMDEALYAQLMDAAGQQITDLRFCGLVYGITAYGTKPQ